MGRMIWDRMSLLEDMRVLPCAVRFKRRSKWTALGSLDLCQRGSGLQIAALLGPMRLYIDRLYCINLPNLAVHSVLRLQLIAKGLCSLVLSHSITIRLTIKSTTILIRPRPNSSSSSSSSSPLRLRTRLLPTPPIHPPLLLLKNLWTTLWDMTPLHHPTTPQTPPKPRMRTYSIPTFRLTIKPFPSLFRCFLR